LKYSHVPRQCQDISAKICGNNIQGINGNIILSISISILILQALAHTTKLTPILMSVIFIIVAADGRAHAWAHTTAGSTEVASSSEKKFEKFWGKCCHLHVAKILSSSVPPLCTFLNCRQHCHFALIICHRRQVRVCQRHVLNKTGKAA
jgi:hypothetical protein